jgi:hypothetical protein
MSYQLESLLNEVAFKTEALNEAKKRFSAQLAPEFRLFDYLRTDEMGLSWCIASLLDPKGKHGQGGVYLDAFLSNYGPLLAWAKDANGCQVVTEKQANGMRRIDIYLEFSNGIIGIENKPWAGDQVNQLTDYASYLKKVAGNRKWFLIYLSNSDPSENSITEKERKKLEMDGTYYRCDYSNLVDWLQACACKSKAPVVRMFIEELSKFIRSDVNGELDMSEKMEVCKIILKPGNISPAFRIFKAMSEVKNELLSRFRGDLERDLELHGMKLDWNLEGWRAYIGFNIDIEGIPQHLNFRFQFEKTGRDGFFWGISRGDKSYHDPVIWKSVNNLMTRFGSTKSSPDWPWYSEEFPGFEFSSEMKNWSNSETPWIKISDGSLVKIITELAVQVQSAFVDAK